MQQKCDENVTILCPPPQHTLHHCYICHKRYPGPGSDSPQLRTKDIAMTQVHHCLPGAGTGTGTDRDAERDFADLVTMAERIRANYVDRDATAWAASPVNWIRQVPSSHKKGKIGESLVMEWARDNGLEVRPRRHRGHDCIIAGAAVEVKLSLRWNNDKFTFLGIRDFNYDVAALLGIAPNEAHLWIVPKPVLWARARPQERGASGRGSKWLAFPANNPPDWLGTWGGSFAEARNALEQAREYTKQEP
jgi:hypothetical protein